MKLVYHIVGKHVPLSNLNDSLEEPSNVDPGGHWSPLAILYRPSTDRHYCSVSQPHKSSGTIPQSDASVPTETAGRLHDIHR